MSPHEPSGLADFFLQHAAHLCAIHRRMVLERPVDTKVLRPQVPYTKPQETTESWEDWPGPLGEFKADELEVHSKPCVQNQAKNQKHIISSCKPCSVPAYM